MSYFNLYNMTNFGKEALEPIESQRAGELVEIRPAYDEVFGELSRGGPKYRNVSCLGINATCGR